VLKRSDDESRFFIACAGIKADIRRPVPETTRFFGPDAVNQARNMNGLQGFKSIKNHHHPGVQDTKVDEKT